MLTLGVETSCDETAVALTSGTKVVASVVSSSVHLHKRYGGVVPEIASRFHIEYIAEVLRESLKRAGATLEDIGLVSVTDSPGLVGALLIGVSFAKAISYSLKRPLIGVNHVLAHLYSAFLNDEKDLAFPFVGLVVSGGHTALFLCEGLDTFKLLGQTQDDAVGEAFDKVAKLLGLGYPGGPVIERMAALAKGRKDLVFPRTYLGKDSLDFSFSGIKTAVLYYVQKSAPKGLLVSEIANAFQEAVLNVLAEKAFLAAKVTGAKTVVVGGGVAANSRLREIFSEGAGFKGCAVCFPRKEYCLDNAAMIGAFGEALYRKGYGSDLYLSAEPSLSAKIRPNRRSARRKI